MKNIKIIHEIQDLEKMKTSRLSRKKSVLRFRLKSTKKIGCKTDTNFSKNPVNPKFKFAIDINIMQKS